MAAYQLFDQSGGVSTPTTGPELGFPLGPAFQADTLGHAQSVAQIFATLTQHITILVPLGSTTGPFTAYQPAAAGSALGSAPTGITF